MAINIQSLISDIEHGIHAVETDLPVVVTDVEDALDAVDTLIGVAEKYDAFLNPSQQAVLTEIQKDVETLLDALHSLHH
jgi:hypothetical protein